MKIKVIARPRWLKLRRLSTIQKRPMMQVILSRKLSPVTTLL
jgi:hypothetical protein